MVSGLGFKVLQDNPHLVTAAQPSALGAARVPDPSAQDLWKIWVVL